jgi:RNA polymerase sigma-70 factor, ECF subfamily
MTEPTGRPVAGVTAVEDDGADVGLEMLEAIRTGDESTFVWIVRVWSPFLLRTAVVLTADRDGSQDVVKDTWLRVLSEVAGFRPPPRPRAWVCALMLQAIDLSDSDDGRDGTADSPSVEPARFRPPGDPNWPGHWAVPPSAWPAMDDSRADARGVGIALRSALDQLPKQQRVVLALRDVAGCELPEISLMLHQDPDHVVLQLHRGRSALRRQLEMHFDEVRTA